MPKRFENVKSATIAHTVTAESIYGLKDKEYTRIPKPYCALCGNTIFFLSFDAKNTSIMENICIDTPNLLNRDFHTERPNQKWVTDISYIKTGECVLYLSVIRDLYDNSIVAYKTGTDQNINLVLSTIKAVQRKEKVTAEL